MSLANPIAISYGGFTAGGISSGYQLDGPYIIDKSHDTLRVVFTVICVASSVGGLQSLSEHLEDSFQKRDQDLSISMSGSSWSYAEGTDLLNVTASCAKTGNRETDRGASRAYTCTVQGDLPATDTDGLRDLEVHVTYTPSRQAIVTMRGVYTALQGTKATEQYKDDVDDQAMTILTGVSDATFELVSEDHARDRLDALCTFNRQYQSILTNQSTSKDDTDIVDHRVVFTDLSQHPGDSAESVYRLRRVVGNYDCSVNVEENDDLQDVFDSKVKTRIIQAFQDNFSPQVFAIEDIRASFDESAKRISASIQILYQSSDGEAVVEVSQSVAYRETRNIDYTPVHGQDEFAAYADPGWAVRERVWSRTVIIVGEDNPKKRIGERPDEGDAKLFPQIGDVESVDNGDKSSVKNDGWNIISNTSQMTPQWVGDPGGDEDQVRLTVLTETVVERYNKAPSGSSGNPTTGTGQ